jgi:acetyl-CoA synthetase
MTTNIGDICKVSPDSTAKNKSGKILRRVLRARYLGQDPGDLSTIEDSP